MSTDTDTLLSLWRSLGVNLLSLQSAHDSLNDLAATPLRANRQVKIKSSFHRLLQAQSAVNELTEYAVRQARADRLTWAEIGHQLGITPQAAHKRFRHLDR